jgi:23S rRNA (pseudouridine1915-N3)-methyltransferase
MQIALVAVGRLRPYYRDACDDYLRRLRRHAKVTEHELREGPDAGAGVQRRDEAIRIRAQVPTGAQLVALAIEGEAWSSEALAERVDRWRLAARPVALAIGGATGLDDALLREADVQWSLGPLTLPHELARVVVCEQLYRAFSILAGAPYHK